LLIIIDNLIEMTSYFLSLASRACDSTAGAVHARINDSKAPYDIKVF